VKLSEPFAAVALLVLAIACAGLLLTLERAVPPRVMPSLQLPAGPVRAQLAADRALVAKLPESEAVEQLRAVLLEQELAAAGGPQEARVVRHRRSRLQQACLDVGKAHGDAGADAFRALAAERIDAALALTLPEEEARRVLKGFATVLAREHVTRDARVVGPRFVVRTMYKARHNLLCGWVPDSGLSRIEQRAFYGWQALHAERVALVRRLQALDRYAEAGGEDVAEARGILLFQGGDFAGAMRALEAAQRETGSLRLRNHIAAVRVAAMGRGGPDPKGP
jgi:hypothetical protein